MNTTVKIFLGLVILAVIGGGVYYLFNNSKKLPETAMVPTSPTPAVAEIIPSDVSMNDLMAGGSSYRDPSGVFTFLYPNDFKFDTQNNDQVVRVYKQGPTQQGQTEMYDGIIVTFEKINLNGQTLSTWIDAELKTMTENGMSEITQPKKSVTVNGFPGYSYSARGLGEFQFLIIQKDAASPNAVRVSAMVADPSNAGFQKQAAQIMASLQLQQ